MLKFWNYLSRTTRTLIQTCSSKHPLKSLLRSLICKTRSLSVMARAWLSWSMETGLEIHLNRSNCTPRVKSTLWTELTTKEGARSSYSSPIPLVMKKGEVLTPSRNRYRTPSKLSRRPKNWIRPRIMDSTMTMEEQRWIVRGKTRIHLFSQIRTQTIFQKFLQCTTFNNRCELWSLLLTVIL